MPIDFNTDEFNNTDTLTRAQRLFDNPTGWGDRVIQMLSNAFGDDNPFGSAALLDAGGVDGVPVIGEDGSLESFIGDATTDAKGLVTSNQLQTASEVQTALAVALSTIGASRLNIVDARLGSTRRISSTNELSHSVTQVVFSTASSIIMISGAGRTAPITGDVIGILQSQPVSLAPTFDVDNNSTRILINSGRPSDQPPLDGYRTLDGTALDTSGDSVSYLSQAQLDAFGLSWGFRIRGWGSDGGLKTFLSGRDQNNGWSPRQVTERGVADLLIAYKPAATTMWSEYYYYNQDFTPPQPPLARNPTALVLGSSGYAVEILL